MLSHVYGSCLPSAQNTHQITRSTEMHEKGHVTKDCSHLVTQSPARLNACGHLVEIEVFRITKRIND